MSVDPAGGREPGVGGAARAAAGDNEEATDVIRVHLHLFGGESQESIASILRGMSTVEVVDRASVAAVSLVVADGADLTTAKVVSAIAESSSGRIVVIASMLGPTGAARLLRAGASAAIRSEDVTSARLARTLSAAVEGDVVLPADLVSSVALARGSAGRGPAPAEFTSREIDVLRLVADGLSTDEIAHTLSYSERTVKNVLHAVTTRFELRSRSHAVAFAVRTGAI